MSTKEKHKKRIVTKVSLKASHHKGKSEKTEEEVLPKKINTRPLEIEEVEILVETEKIADEAVLEDGEAEEAEEAGLNEEDLDPFGDKWEQ